MGRLPFLISVPHAGLEIPSEVSDICTLNREEIRKDGDEGAGDIYDIRDNVIAYCTTNVARAIVDLNRREDDRTADGVVKTHTIWNVPIYSRPLSEELIHGLLEKYYKPYHNRLTDLTSADLVLGIDCHTMAEQGPPIGPDTGESRPDLCLSNGDGTCPREWAEILADSLQQTFERKVSINDPFRGGYIIRAHARELPWIQLEISRKPFLPFDEKRTQLLRALELFRKKTQ